MNTTFKNVGRLLYDLLGWHTSKKIVVIESDDWGSIRMPSLKTLKAIPNQFKKSHNSPYSKFDSLASSKDIEGLYDVLSSIRDKNGRKAVITANCIMANPDFEKIKASNFTEYFYEDFTTTIKRYHGDETLKLWDEGIESNIFYPQLHGREHVDVTSWMKELSNKNQLYLDAFERGIFSVDHNLQGKKKNFTAALDTLNQEDAIFKSKIIGEACQLFEARFGYKSSSFIAPSYTWDDKIEEVLNENNVKFMQGIRVQKVPTHQDMIYKYKKHFLGEKNNLGQHYLVRNVFFEPSLLNQTNHIDEALGRIYWSFKFKRPAIISMHRLNVIGEIDHRNRDKNLASLKQLLQQIVKNWPDVEFMTTSELGSLCSDYEL